MGATLGGGAKNIHVARVIAYSCRLGLAAGFTCHSLRLNSSHALAMRWKAPSALRFWRSNVGTPLFDRIGALAHEVASGGGATSCFSQSDIGVGAKAQEVFFPGARTAIAK
jgi:hypothetical protein